MYKGRYLYSFIIMENVRFTRANAQQDHMDGEDGMCPQTQRSAHFFGDRTVRSNKQLRGHLATLHTLALVS